MSLLSVVCQLYADVKKITNVPRGAFRPAPKVDSAIIVLVPLLSKEGLGVVTDPESVIRLAKAGFASRRKQLHRNLAAAGFGTSDQIKRHLAALGLPPTARAENLTVHNWIELTHLL
jgi:16S rRNA (adenine1518-N6/adenine1519-N6)-dimethyltransferase